MVKDKAIIHVIQVSERQKEGLIIPLDAVGFIRCEYRVDAKGLLDNVLTINLKFEGKPVRINDIEGTVYRLINDFGHCVETVSLKEFETVCIKSLLGTDLYQSAESPTV